MSYILNIETATRNCSVSIARDGEVIALKEVAESGYSHAEKLHVFIEEALLESQLRFSDLQAVAVSQGPGSYTGLRIGVSAAKGLCYALNIPLIAVDTLQVLASQVQINDGLIVPMIDARRMEVYSAIYDTQFHQVRGVEAQIIDENSFAEYGQNLYFVGDCQSKCQEVLKAENHFFLSEIEFPSAKEMATISHQKFTQNSFEDLAYFEPFYLKDFVGTMAKK
ncbi:MAG: tRNA (adenosine(37)-N6)-threonylcarbamoyltransferase complex dimerization subunit type 1 TsaB [Bacteroidetes bacterium]|nr:tRNA (adenosine(37)-N6)-threonylcarbamoyltransferase complex dimerization subunit type 1 TsaB [Bacteroidota bacterium]